MLKFKSTGNIHFRPYGKLVFYNKRKKEVGTIKVDGGWPVYPGRTKIFTAKGNFKMPNDRYRVKMQIYYNKKKQRKLVDKVYKVKVRDENIRIK